MIVRHTRRTLEALVRRYKAREALGTEAEAGRRDRERASLYLESLPPPMSRIRVAILTGVALALASQFLQATGPVVGNVFSELPLPRDASEVMSRFSSSLDLSEQSFRDTVDSLFSSRPDEILLLVLALAVIVYIVLRPLVPSFRCKRGYFCLFPNLERAADADALRWTRNKSVGVYELEKELFAALSSLPPREVPLDLLLSAVAAAIGLALFVGGIVYEFKEGFMPSTLLFLGGLLAGFGWRLAWLTRTWNRRRGSAYSIGPRWVSLPGSPVAIRIRSARIVVVAYAVSALFAIGFVWESQFVEASEYYREPLLDVIGIPIVSILLPAMIVWWYRVSTDLYQFEVASGIEEELDFGRDLLALTILLGFVVPPLRAGARLSRRLRRAERGAELAPKRLPDWIVGLGVVPLWAPLFAVHVQARLNSIWAKTAHEVGFSDSVLDIDSVNKTSAPFPRREVGMTPS